MTPGRTPYNRGYTDGWYRRPSVPHKWHDDLGRDVDYDLNVEEKEQYKRGREAGLNHDGKDY